MINAISTSGTSSYLSSLTSNTSSSTSSSSTSSTTTLPTQDSIDLQLASSLLSSLSQSGTSTSATTDYPTNILQSVQDQETLSSNTDLQQTLSERASSSTLEPLMAEVETLPNGQSGISMTSLASSMQMLQNLSNSGTLADNPNLAKALAQSYSSVTIPSSGSVVDTSA